MNLFKAKRHRTKEYTPDAYAYVNEKIKGVHISRYIASWLNCGGLIYNGNDELFKEWLHSLKDEKGAPALSDDEVNKIVFFATNGRMELESSAKYFIKEKYDIWNEGRNL